MSRNYQEEIFTLIKEEANRYADPNKITLKFVDGVYSEVLKKFRKLEEIIWEVAPLDDETIRFYFEEAKKRFLYLNPVKADPATALIKENYSTWLTDTRKREINWNYTERYFNYLVKRNRADSVITETKNSSEYILGNLGDPQNAHDFFVKGLVVGEVQSGKTENFNAVINRAIDSGYQLILVFSGIMEDLRAQTQDRIEAEIVGWGSVDINEQKWAKNERKGVGEDSRFGIHGDHDVSAIESITSCQTDFSTILLRSSPALTSKKILICKKNVSVLRNLINWLGDMPKAELKKIPILILDDEADNASLNNEGAKGREYASKVNGHIRAILGMFDKKSYLGYTATPFANVLADRNDPAAVEWPVTHRKGEEDRTFEQVNNLFPDDFIVRLKAPTNYIGAKQLFETIAEIPKLPMISVVNDSLIEFPTRLRISNLEPIENIPREEWQEKTRDEGHFAGFFTYRDYKEATRAAKREDNFPTALPQSLRDAVLCFVLALAIRDSRKTVLSSSKLNEPNTTMLVHTSLFTSWQNTTRDLIEQFVEEIKHKVENNSLDQIGSIFITFENIWNRYFNDLVTNISEYLPQGYEDNFMRPISYEVIKRYLPSAVENIKVLAINSSTGDKLDYSDQIPRKYIAVGGNTLSRGFTVRGLTINYFIRSTNYSDTLLQMGRWFGYRPGYLDCCRIFTTANVINRFNSTTRCIEELEIEFDKMHDQGKTPRNFLVKVKKHPGALKITRPSILRNTNTIRWSFQDQLEMTTSFDVSLGKINTIWDSFKSNIAPLFSSDSIVGDKEFLKIVLKDTEIINFLEHPNNFDPTTLQSMLTFIKLCQERGALTDWTVAIKLKGRSTRLLQPEVSGLPCETGMVIRRGPKLSEDNNPNRNLFLNQKIFRATGSSANIMSSPRDMSVSLEQFEIDLAEKEYRESKPNNPNSTIPERVYRERIPQNRGVLIIYLFDAHYSFNQQNHEPDHEFKKLIDQEGYDLNIPLVGYAIGFPPIEPDPGREYLHGDYDLEVDEPEETLGSDEDVSVPDDDIGTVL